MTRSTSVSAPLAGVGQSSSDPATERAMRYIFEHSQRFYNFKGLHGFKCKFHPHWSPRYLIYPGPASLFAVVMAVIRVQTGGHAVWRFARRREEPIAARSENALAALARPAAAHSE